MKLMILTRLSHNNTVQIIKSKMLLKMTHIKAIILNTGQYMEKNIALKLTTVLGTANLR